MLQHHRWNIFICLSVVMEYGIELRAMHAVYWIRKHNMLMTSVIFSRASCISCTFSFLLRLRISIFSLLKVGSSKPLFPVLEAFAALSNSLLISYSIQQMSSIHYAAIYIAFKIYYYGFESTVHIHSLYSLKSVVVIRAGWAPNIHFAN